MERDTATPTEDAGNSPACEKTRPESSHNVSVLRNALTSQSFAEKTALLVLTALLSGLIIPAIIGGLHAKRIRDEAILRSQSQLLDDLSTTILTYETLAADVSFFKHRDAKNEALHEVAFKRYNERVVDLVSQWRSLSAKSQTLVSSPISEKIGKFLDRIMVEQDLPMMKLYRDKASDNAWEEQHDKNVEMINEANGLIAEIANDMNLSKEALER